MNRLSQYVEAPTLAHWKACKRVLRYIKGPISYGLEFRPTQIMNLEGYSGADWASNVDDRKSMSGILYFLVAILLLGALESRRL